MRNTKKMILVPAQDGDGDADIFADPRQPESAEPRKKNSIRQYALDRQRKLISIVLRLASFGGYDEDGRIIDEDGRSLPSSDIVALLLHALSPGRNVSGLNTFVSLLHRANISPDLIINGNVKQMLISRMQRQTLPKTHARSSRPSVPPAAPTARVVPEDRPVPLLPPPPPLQQMVFPERSEKRKRQDDDDEEDSPPKSMQKTSVWDDEDSDLEK